MEIPEYDAYVNKTKIQEVVQYQLNHLNYVYLQDVKYKLNVTLILIEDLRAICTFSHLI